MWNDIVKHLVKFPNAVLIGVDHDGYPFSLRCKPQVDEDRKVLQLSLTAELPIQPGPAGLLCHSHDDQLGNLKSFQVFGSLEQAEQGWAFHPERFIPGGLLLGPIGQLRILFQARAEAKNYLQKRGIPRPKVDWNEVEEVKVEAKIAR